MPSARTSRTTGTMTARASFRARARQPVNPRRTVTRAAHVPPDSESPPTAGRRSPASRADRRDPIPAPTDPCRAEPGKDLRLLLRMETQGGIESRLPNAALSPSGSPGIAETGPQEKRGRAGEPARPREVSL